MVGIIGYGSYIPKFRIKAEQIAHQWGKDAVAIKRGLMLQEKSVPGLDEDTITISVAAAKNALKRCNKRRQRIITAYCSTNRLKPPPASLARSGVYTERKPIQN